MSTNTTLRNDGKNEQITSLDGRWLDEYAKRGLLVSSYAAISNGYLWGIGSIAGTMALKKLAKESFTAHPVKTPLNLAGIAILGYLVACFTQDQVTQINRMRAERLGRRMVLDGDGGNTPAPSAGMDAQKHADSPVQWRKLLRPGWLGYRFPAEDHAFEKQWYHKQLSTRLKRSFFGAAQFGSFVAALTFATGKLIAYAGNELVQGTPPEGEKGTAYHKFHTPAATATMMAVGLMALYKFEQQNTKEKLLEDNYIARKIARRKGGSSPIARDEIALNAGEPLRGKGKEAEKMAEANKQWFKNYFADEFRYGIFNELSKATFLGMFANFSKMLLDKAAGKQVPFHGKRTPLVFAGMMGLGGLCAYAAYHSESKLVKMSDDRLAKLMNGGTPNSKRPQPQSRKAVPSTAPGISGAGAASPADFQEYDRKWLKDFRTFSFQEALCLALANATFFGMFTKISNMRLNHVADEKIHFDKRRSPLVMGSMAMAGTGIAYVANTRTAMLQKLEDDRLGFRVNAPEKASPQQAKKGVPDGATPPENFQDYDKKWLTLYRNFAFQKGLYDAIANATFFGMFSSMSTMLLDKTGGKSLSGEFSPLRSSLAMGGLMGLGTIFAYMAQDKGALIKKLHSDRLAHRVKAEEKTKEETEPETSRLQTRLPAKNINILDVPPTLVATDPAISYWQNRVENSRNVMPKTFSLCA